MATEFAPKYILRQKQGFICTNKDSIITILYAANEIAPQKLPLQKTIMKSIIIPMIKKILDLVCDDKIDAI
jgi:hypothetical protein